MTSPSQQTSQFCFTDRKLHVISVWNICKHSSDQFARKPVVESQNVSYFLRVASISSAELELLFPITYEFVYAQGFVVSGFSERMNGIVATQVTTTQGKFV